VMPFSLLQLMSVGDTYRRLHRQEYLHGMLTNIFISSIVLNVARMEVGTISRIAGNKYVMPHVKSVPGLLALYRIWHTS
jgi:hypothetical protein